MGPIAIALAVVAPAVYSVSECVALTRARPYSRWNRRPAWLRILMGVGFWLVTGVEALVGGRRKCFRTQMST